MNSCKVGSIRKIHKRLQDEGYDVSEYRLRLWAKQGLIYVVHTGTKALISFDNVVALLEGTGSSPFPAA